jgi:hypothetical protein
MSRQDAQFWDTYVQPVIPAGMLLLIEQYPWPVVGAAVTRSVFTWFLTSAPAEALAALSVPEPPSFLRYNMSYASFPGRYGPSGAAAKETAHCGGGVMAILRTH